MSYQAMQLPKIEDEPTDELIEFMNSGMMEVCSSRDGEVELIQDEVTIIAKPGHWIVKDEMGRFDVFSEKQLKLSFYRKANSPEFSCDCVGHDEWCDECGEWKLSQSSV